jgi:hypothetical protein
MNQQSRSLRQQAAQEFTNALDQLKETFEAVDERLADAPLVPDPPLPAADALPSELPSPVPRSVPV